MPNILDYIAWRGDLTLEAAPFNDVDNLILSRLSFIPFEGVVPRLFDQSISLVKAAKLIKAAKNPAPDFIMREDPNLLHAAANCKRFGDMQLSGFINHIDTTAQKQFAAVVFQLQDDSIYIAFRGTDKTLVGWKEDFNMSFMTSVPAQEHALGYLENAAAFFPNKMHIGGHSKGGNLAVYSSAFCSQNVQDRIIKVYNNDGPGFHNEVISQPGYARIRDRTNTFVPQTSVVGMLLEHEEKYTIIHSTEIGLMQHDLYSWEVMRDHFICLDNVSSSSKFIDQTLKTWVTQMTPDERGDFIDALYSIIATTEAKTFSDLTGQWHKNALLILKSIMNMNENMRNAIARALLLLFKSGSNHLAIFKHALLDKLKL